MDWSTRMKIATGSTKGLAYLHEDCEFTVIPKSYTVTSKASNNLLDINFEAKISIWWQIQHTRTCGQQLQSNRDLPSIPAIQHASTRRRQ
ncbi:Proline-rich receptor protein kinase PERK7 [Spatholobus suberectus]|nr:Proline-rich receptor protein kinase PERK7 [Spatholobus suberectus]